MGISFVDPPDNTPLANIYNRMRALRAAIDAHLDGASFPVTLAASVVAANNLGVRVRSRGRTVTLCCEIQAQADKAANTALFTIPVGARPTDRVATTGFTSNGMVMVWIEPTGVVTTPFAPLINGHQLYFNAAWSV